MEYCTDCPQQEGDLRHSISQCPHYFRYIGAEFFLFAPRSSINNSSASAALLHPSNSASKEDARVPHNDNEVRISEPKTNGNESLMNSPIPISNIRPGILEPLAINAHLIDPVVSLPDDLTKRTSKEPSKPDLSIRSKTLSSTRRTDSQQADIKSLAGRSHSLGSMLDYGTPTQWVRRLLRQPESYTPQFTAIPSRDKSTGVSFADPRRHSDQNFSGSVSRRQTGKSAFSAKSSHRIDSFGFRRAVSDMERLLGEALNLASQVVDRSETPTKDHHGHHLHHRLSQSNSHTISSDEESFASAKEGVEASSVVDLSEQPCRKRPGYKYAATYCGSPERPRLADIVERYSGYHEGTRSKNLECDCCHDSVPCEAEDQVLISVPHRVSSHYFAMHGSRNTQGYMMNGISEPQSREFEVRDDDLTSTTTVVDFSSGKENRRRFNILSKNKGNSYPSAVIETPGKVQIPPHSGKDLKRHHGHGISLKKRSHVSLRNTQGFSLVKSHKRHPIARDWSPIRKRFVAGIACLSTALIGILLGIYAGLVPSIQYYILDQSHETIHGNTGCFLGLALSTFFFWPLPLLHGRKPYIMSSLALAMPLIFPQALAVYSQRLTHIGSWRAMLIASRTLMGCALGFASMNFHSILTDLFGASLMSHNPHQEVVDKFDARRHGGGMGVWLGIWTWCWVGSLGLGFLAGAAIIDHHPPAWGFYLSIILIAIVLLLNVVCPEVRRSAFRRSVTEVRTGSDISRRLARGEIKMHRVKTGPRWWGEEVYHGMMLSFEMVRQPGFAVMAIYVSWIYAQVVLIIVLLGSLASRHYRLHATYVGLHVAGITLGALLVIPFEKASFFSRSRHFQFDTSRATLDRKMTWSSHLIRRAVFTILLPIAGGCYAAVSSGPPLSIGVPTFFATCVGSLSCLAIAECNGLIMETFDTSDLSPGMTGRPRNISSENQKRTNYSSFPRVSAGFAVIHTLAFILAAGSTALGGHITRTVGQQVATAIVAGILFVFTVMLLLVSFRFRNVLIVPRSKSAEMDRVTEARRKSTMRRVSMPHNPQAIMEEENAWRPFMMGNPTGKKRRMNMLELGNMSRWQDIRRKNKIIDQGAHLSPDAIDQGFQALDAALENELENLRHVEGIFKPRKGKSRFSNRLRRTEQQSSDPYDVEMDFLNSTISPNDPHQVHSYAERDCFIGQTVEEEKDEDVQASSSGQRKT